MFYDKPKCRKCGHYTTNIRLDPCNECKGTGFCFEPKEKTCDNCADAMDINICLSEKACINHDQWKPILEEPPIAPEDPTPDYYNYMYKGVQFDPYRAGIIYNITCPAMFHAFKKIIRAGQNKKSLKQDIEEAIKSLQRKLKIMEEDA